MAEDLVLQHPHVHEWTEQDGRRRGQVWHGPIYDYGPPLGCECGEVAGDWGEVVVQVSVDGNFDLKVSEIWPDGKYPIPVTADAVVAEFEKQGGRRNVMSDWGLDEYDVTVYVGGESAVVWSPYRKRV